MKVFIICEAKSATIEAIEQLLTTRGDKVVIAVSNTDSALQTPHIVIGSRLDRMIHTSLGHLSDTHLLHSARATASLFDIIIAHDPDVIHIFDITKGYINLPLTAHLLNRYRIPTLVTIDNPSMIYQDTPALFKRRRHNSALFKRILDEWETLQIAIPDRKYSEHPLLSQHPCYTVAPDTPSITARNYITIYDAIK
jgi:hypothetical protein